MAYRMIIVDDEETIREGLSKSVGKTHPEIHIIGMADNGVDAWELYLANPGVEFILMDINIPKINGLEIVERILKEDRLCKIIIISGYSEFSYAQSALKMGVFDYLLKPVNQAALKNCLDKALASYRERLWEINQLKDIGGRESRSYRDSSKEAVSFIAENYTDSELSLNSVAERFAVSPSYLSRLIKQNTGLTFSDYITQLRIEQAKVLLLSGKAYMIYEVANWVGYSSQHYFSRIFKEYTGLSPREFRESSHPSE